MNKNHYLILLLILMSISTQIFAQVCSVENSYSEINQDCIQKYIPKLEKNLEKNKNRAKEIQKLKEKKEVAGSKIRKAEFFHNLVIDMENQSTAEAAINKTFFYQTSSGLLGKFVVRQVRVSSSECSLFVEAMTFSNKRALEMSTNVFISNESNAWGRDDISFDESGTTDFAMMRETTGCVFKSVEGNAIVFGKTNEVEKITGNPILYYASLFLFGLAVLIIMQTMFADEDRFKAETRLDEADEDAKNKTPNDIVLKYSRPFFKRYFSPIVQGMKYKKKIREKYKRKLASSGMNRFLTPEDFYAFKLFLILGFPIMYLGGGKFLEFEIELSYVPLLLIAGYFYPDLWIREKIAKRKEEILLNMPFVMDMLALSVEAGLDFVGAISKVIEKAPDSALVDEFEIFLKETKVGSSRAEALRALSWRVDTLPISSFCATLIAADSVGASNLAPILKSLSAEIRQKRSSDIEKKGAQAATKILFPMLFLILPAVILIIAAPFVIEFMGN